MGAERGGDGFRALTFAIDYVRGLNFVGTNTSDLLTHADLNNKQSSTLLVYTMLLHLDKLCNVLLYE